MVNMMLGDAFRSDRFQFVMFGGCENNQWRKKLLQHIAVLLQHQTEEFFDIMCHKVDFQLALDARLLDSFFADFESDDIF